MRFTGDIESGNFACTETMPLFNFDRGFFQSGFKRAFSFLMDVRVSLEKFKNFSSTACKGGSQMIKHNAQVQPLTAKLSVAPWTGGAACCTYGPAASAMQIELGCELQQLTPKCTRR
jgi:hypothetical protein